MTAHNKHPFTPDGVTARINEAGKPIHMQQLGEQFGVTTLVAREMVNRLVAGGLVKTVLYNKHTSAVPVWYQPPVYTSATGITAPRPFKPYVPGKEWAVVKQRIGEIREHPSRYFDEGIV